MDFKRKIALVILAGLLLSLLGSFSYLMAMETAVIKDFKGQTVQLADEQKDALSRCETLKHMIQDIGLQEISFEGVGPFITSQNLQQVANLIKNKKYLDQIVNSTDCIELFKLADYMHAPDEVLAILADRIYEPIIDQIKATEDSQAKADLEYFKENVESKLSYYPHFSALVKDRNIDWEKRDEERNRNVYVLSFPHISHGITLHKKLRSLEGIKVLADCPWATYIDTLCINHHDIQEVDLAQIIKVFPALRRLQLGDNKIKNVHYGIQANNLSIDLRNNPLESICVANPDQLKNVGIEIDKDCKPVVTFNPAPGKLRSWLEAFKAQSKVALNRPGMLKIACMVGCLGGPVAVLAAYTFKWARGKNIENYYSWIKKQLISPQAFIHIVGCSSFTSLAACMGHLLDTRTQIKRDLAVAAWEDKHVQVDHVEPYHHGHMRIVPYYKYPSKYEYNLFGKN